MEKLKFELVNGYGVLVDESAEINNGELLWDDEVKEVMKMYKSPDKPKEKYQYKIIFAEPELNLEGVPVFEWRDFDDAEECLKKQTWDTTITLPFNQGFIEGYKSNPAKYTEEDLRKIAQAAFVVMMNPETVIADFDKWFEKRLQSLQKYPKFIEIEDVIEGKAKIANIIW